MLTTFLQMLGASLLSTLVWSVVLACIFSLAYESAVRGAFDI